ncbi:hypothetical protein LRX75_19055 [Rhizobium sp. DKSPLA3]|uniref:Uncharacterized protein n=1 Tax=Rhizobium quercicola TaxID=2901226 RepID=A0A9X1NWT1_9HYPH|nr:hypothetical protein [Rhizobium quercicola]MCD7111139.1 hypothetical protein [Rhizobium quercicola]
MADFVSQGRSFRPVRDTGNVAGLAPSAATPHYPFIHTASKTQAERLLFRETGTTALDPVSMTVWNKSEERAL